MSSEKAYESFLELVKYRRSIRKFKPDPVPDEYITKILDAAHYAISGANSQPWDFVVIKDPKVKERLVNAYRKYHFEEVWYIEQLRVREYRHPTYTSPIEERDKDLAMIGGWGSAPVIIAVLQDPRKQLGSVLAAFLPGSEVLGKSVAHCTMVLHLAAASLGLGSQHVSVTLQQPFREILGYPEPLTLNVLIPIGYRPYEPGPPHRLPLEQMVHFDKYDMSKYLRNEDILKYMERIRALGRPGYRVSIGEDKG